MWNFIVENQKVSWLIFVLLITFAIRGLINLVASFLKKRDASRSGQNVSTISLMQKMAIGFLYALAVLFASYAVLEKDVYEIINNNILIMVWIGGVLSVTVIGVAFSQRYFTRKIEAASSRDKQDPTAYKFLNYFVTFFIWFLGISLAAFAIPALRGLAQSALAGAGVLTVLAGIASQEGIANIAGGILIVFFRPFRIGDTIKVGQHSGTVEDLTLRHTVIKDFHSKRIVIPNATMNKETIINYNLGEATICEWMELGIGYDSDVDKAISIVQSEVEQHQFFYDGRTKAEKKQNAPKVKVKVTGWGDSSVNLRVWLWAKDVDAVFSMKHDLFKSIKARFDAEGIEIPFPHRMVVMKQ